MKIEKAHQAERLINQLNKINTNITTLQTIRARGVGPEAVGIGLHCSSGPGSAYFLRVMVPSGMFDVEEKLVALLEETLCQARNHIEKELEAL
jgi:hypothetical protein